MAGMKPAKHGRDHCPGGEDPITCMGAVEWANITASNASLGTSLTAVELSGISGWYDSSTFSLSSGDLVIGKPGLYSFTILSRGWTLQANKVTVLFLEFSKTVGTAGDWSGAVVGSAGFASATRLLRFDNATDDYSLISNPDLFTYAAWDTGDTLPTLQLTAYIEEDETGVAHSEGDFRVFAIRLGANHGE